MTLQDKVIAKIKEYFPDAEFKSLDNKAYEIALNLQMGIAPPKNEVTEPDIDCLARRFRVISVDSQAEANNEIINDLSELRFYKNPSQVFIRSVYEGSHREFTSEITSYIAEVRFSLGYSV